MKLSDFHEGMEGWEPVNTEVSKTPQLPNPETQVTPFLRAILPLPLQYSGDTIKQYNRPGLSAFRIAPLPANGMPGINAAIQSTAGSVVAAAIAAIPPVDDVEEICISKQPGTAYTLQLIDRGNLLTFDNGAGGTITLPGAPGSFTAGLGPFDKSTGATGSGTIEATPALTPATSGEWAFLTQGNVGGGSATFPAPWVTLAGSAEQQTIAGITPVTGNATLSGSSSEWAMGLLLFKMFGGGSPVLVNNRSRGGAFSPPFDIGSPTFTITAGNTIIVTNYYHILGAGTVTCSDSLGNVYVPRLDISDVNNRMIIFVCENALGGSATISIGGSATGNSSVSEAFEIGGGVSGASAANGFPKCWFTYIENTGSGSFTLTSLAKIDTRDDDLVIGPNQGVLLATDGFDWFTERGMGITTPVTVPSGGTGDTTLTAHAVLLGEGTSPVAFASPGAAGGVLTSNGAGADPSFQASSPSLPVSVPNGGTGDTTLTAHGVLIGEGTSPVAVTSPGTVGQVLTSNGSGADPTFQTNTPAIATAVKINGVGVSTDKQFFINAVTDGSAPTWTIQINGVTDGG